VIFIDIFITGIINGSTYALLAIGFSIIFGAARIINLAHTAFYMVAAYCIYFFTSNLGVNPVWGMIIAIILVFLLGILIYQLLLRPIREHDAAVMIATIAMAMAMEELMSHFFSGSFLSVPSLIKGFATIFGTKIFYQQILTFCAALIVQIILWILMMKTRLGLAIRSTAQDREVTNLMGINESRVAMWTMGISVGLAAFTGAIIVPLTVIDPHMWTPPLIMMMAVVVLGGLGSLKGSFIGAYILGFAEALVVFLVPAGAFLKGSVALSIMILVLIIRPEGLFGVTFEEER
jgi:branched-chain amino acid transport system permease protein